MGARLNYFSPVRNPDVSVLMSCYNASHWLREAIDSVLSQTFQNFEFIIVDDGSTDETWNIIRSYCERDERVVAISKKNTGLADSLNVGIAQAKGTWIARLDADDLCEASRLEEQVAFMRNHPGVVLLGTGFIEIDDHDQTITKHLYPSGHRRLVRHLERSMRFFPHSSVFYRVDMVKQVGGYNLRMHRSQDKYLWLEFASRGTIACLRKPLVRIRKHAGQISLDDGSRRQLCDATVAIVCHLLRQAGCEDPSVVASADEWAAFLNWIETRIEESCYFEKRRTWADARAEYFATNNSLAGAVRFGARLLESGHASVLTCEKFFGFSLPKRWAQEWMKRTIVTQVSVTGSSTAK